MQSNELNDWDKFREIKQPQIYMNITSNPGNPDRGLGAEERSLKNATELLSRDGRLATIARISKTNLILPDINIKRPIGVEPLKD